MHLFQWHHRVITLWMNSAAVLWGNNRDKNANTHIHTYTQSQQGKGLLNRTSVSHVEYILLKLPTGYIQGPSTVCVVCSVRQLLITGKLSPFPGLYGDPVNRKKMWAWHNSGSDYFIASLVAVGGQEWMSLIDMSAISLAPTLACCLSFLQNGAESWWVVGWKHRMYRHWVMVLSVPPEKALTCQEWNLSPFLLPVPITAGLWWASEKSLNI